MVSWRDRDVGLDPGTVWNGQAKLESRRTTWTANYIHETTTSQLLQKGTIFVDLLTGQLVLNPQPGQLVVPVDIFIPTNVIFVRKRADLSSEFKGHLVTTSVVAYYERRETLGPGQDEKHLGGIASVTTRFSPLTSLLMSGGYERVDQGTDGLRRAWYGSIGPTRRLGQHATLNLNYRYAQTMGHNPPGYRENRVMLQLESEW
jgi:uncharacterized protein (PEP-CTERM system associated)